MGQKNISLPDCLMSFVDEQFLQQGHGTRSEHVCELIGKDQDRLQLRSLLWVGAASNPAAPADAAYFEGPRCGARKVAKPNADA